MKTRTFVILTILLVGCTSPGAYHRSRANADRAASIDVGQAKQEIVAILGAPDFREASLEDGRKIEALSWLTNYDHHIYTRITFEDEIAIRIEEYEGPAPQ